MQVENEELYCECCGSEETYPIDDVAAKWQCSECATSFWPDLEKDYSEFDI